MRIGAYEVVRPLGRGSMGAVYLAQRAGLERSFALKVMNRDVAGDREAVLRFRQEARVASRIDHPGVVPVVDAGDHEGVPFYVMGYCPGETLQSLLRRGPLDARSAATLVRALADAVAAAHAAGCIHRDLKPANVIIDPDTGHPRITDFGLARDARAQDRLTRTGEVLGTPYYMAPEQVRGDKDGDERIDVYALGVILYECLSGARPYSGSSSAIVAREILGGRAVPLRSVHADVPNELHAIVDAAIATDRAARYPTAAALRGALDAWLAGGATRADEGRDVARFALRLAVFTVAFVVVTTGAVVAIVLHRSSVADAARRAEAERVERLRGELEAREKADRERAAREAAERRRRAEEAAAAAAEEERKRNEVPDLSGTWRGAYGPHGEEVIDVKHEGASVVATKLTGDPNVPAGKVTFRATLEGREGPGEMQLAETGYRNPRFAKGKLTVVDANTIQFHVDAFGITTTLRREK